MYYLCKQQDYTQQQIVDLLFVRRSDLLLFYAFCRNINHKPGVKMIS